MAKEPKLYTRLTRNTAGFGAYTSLWLAADHLLIARSNGYTEDYSRVQLRDIKAIFVTPGKRRLWWAVVWGGVAGIGALTVTMSIVAGRTPIFSTIGFVLGAVGLVWNHLLGAGCSAHLVTGVQTAVLPPLVRMKKTRRVLGRLQPLIAAAQADLAPVLPATPDPAPPPSREEGKIA